MCVFTEWCDMLARCIKAITQGSVLHIDGPTKRLVQKQNAKMLEEVLKEYKKEMNVELPVKDVTIIDINHARSEKKALDYLEANTHGDLDEMFLEQVKVCTFISLIIFYSFRNI